MALGSWITRRLVPLAALLAPVAASAQSVRETSTYEAIYGTPVDVTITDLLLNPEQYSRRAVRTRGRLDLPHQGGGEAWMLRDGASTGVLIVPMRDVASDWEYNARTWLGRSVEVVGVVQALSSWGGSLSGESTAVIQFWAFTGPEEEAPKDIADRAKGVALETLVSRPGSNDGDIVRVIGKFRGRNLYGDLPAKSQSRSGDWVIKDDLYAVWVTGKKPKGRGWELDIDMKKDTGKWIEVIGKPTTRGGVTYVRAMEVRLSAPPSPVADAAPPPPPPPAPKVPPVVVFALPLDGDAEVPASTRFVVQFSKDMDVESFKGRVLLSYAPLLPGDRMFDGMSVTYDGGLRALTVDPGDTLRPGRSVELRLLPGIVDIEGLELVPRASNAADGIVDVLRYYVGG